MRKKLLALLVLALGTMWLSSGGAAAPDPMPTGGPTDPTLSTDQKLIDRMRALTGGDLRVSYHTETGRVRYIGAGPGRAIPHDGALAADSDAEMAARNFLGTYGVLFGLSNQAQDLILLHREDAGQDRSMVRFQQVYQGIPVLGGELIVQLDGQQNVLSANGEVLPQPKLDVKSPIPAQTARDHALQVVAKAYALRTDELVCAEPSLWIYAPSLLGQAGLHHAALVWRVEVKSAELRPIRELVLIDAHHGSVALHFNQIDTARSRSTYDAGNGTTLPGALVCDESNPTCTSGDADEAAAHKYAGATYDFYATYHHRDSIDDAGMALISTVHYGLSYGNAFWTGEQMVYGDAYGFPMAEDVVAHELTHGVTKHTSHLLYYMQSGAINEAFSDIWGEFVDQIQVTDNDAGDTRWLIGEDVTGLGAIRSMSNPPLYADPDKMTSPYYACGAAAADDNGGVHTNSGVANKAAYLMADGGSFNGQLIAGIGVTKTAKIFYEVQTHLLTSAGDYADLYDGLQQACTNLLGTDGITLADCQQVKKAADATEMNLQPTACPATEAPVCPAGQSPVDLYYDDMESPASGRWITGTIAGTSAWYYPQNPNPYLGWDATYATSGQYNIWGDDAEDISDSMIAMSSDVVLPAGIVPYLRFNQAYSFETYHGRMIDGGVTEYSTNGGASWVDGGSLFTENGYDGTISPLYDNPLSGRQAFGGASNGYSSSRLDLTSLAGKSVRFRFRVGTDSSVGDWGWFIDDVRVYACSASGPSPTPTPTATPISTPVVPGSASLGLRLYLPIVRQSGPAPVYPNDTHYAAQWALSLVHAPEAWASSKGDGLLIAILDSGADFGHPDLAAKLRTDIDRDFVNGDDSADDDYGHGTHVAGIAAAVTNNATGVAGLGWDTQILPLKVLDSTGAGYLSASVDALYYAADQGARVINMSIGTDALLNRNCALNYPAYQAAVDYAHGHGALVVAAAGNDSSSGGVVPANCAHVLGVAATTETDARAYYSDFGSYVDVAAPGGDSAGQILSTCMGGGYCEKKGTSMAAPYVSGLAALLYARYSSYTPDQVASAIMDRAADKGAAGWDPYFGCGRIDAASSLQHGAAGSAPLCYNWSASSVSLAEGFSVAGTYRPGVLIVRLEERVVASALDLLSSYGITGGQQLRGGDWVVQVPAGREEEVLAQLRSDPAVRYAQPDYLLYAR